MNSTPAEEVSYRKEAYDFVTKKSLIQISGVQKAFTVFLYDRQFIYESVQDKRVRQVSQDIVDALIPFFVKMFKIRPDLRWHHAAMFQGNWRKTTREDIARFTGLGPGQLPIFLKLIKKHGLLEVEYAWDAKNKKNQWMWIKVNFQRLKDMLQSAYDWACDHRLFGLCRKTLVKVEVFSDECSKDKIDVVSTVRSQVFSDSGNSGTKKENTASAEPGMESSFVQDKKVIEVDSYTDKVLIHLRKVFRSDEFTVRSVKRVQRLVNSWLYWKKMTEAEVVDFCRLREIGAVSWLTTPMTLDFFITRWSAIKVAVQKHFTEDSAFNAQISLEHFAPGNLSKLMSESLSHVVQRMSGFANPIEKITVYFNWAPDLLDMINTLRLAEAMGYNKATVLEKFRAKFRQLVLSNPRYFVLLEKTFPIRQWAQLNWYECRDLREQAERDAFEDHRSVAVHEVCCV